MKRNKNDTLKVGVSQVNITPWSDVQVAGAVGVRRQARAVLDPLFARAIVLDNGSKKLCLVSGDLTIVARDASDTIRDTAAQRFGFDRDAIVVLHMTSHYVGYVPTRQAFERPGGHETRLSTWSKLAPQALDTIVAAATRSLRRLFADVKPG